MCGASSKAKVDVPICSWNLPKKKLRWGARTECCRNGKANKEGKQLCKVSIKISWSKKKNVLNDDIKSVASLNLPERTRIQLLCCPYHCNCPYCQLFIFLIHSNTWCLERFDFQQKTQTAKMLNRSININAHFHSHIRKISWPMAFMKKHLTWKPGVASVDVDVFQYWMQRQATGWEKRAEYGSGSRSFSTPSPHCVRM